MFSRYFYIRHPLTCDHGEPYTYMYGESWEPGIPKELWKTAQNVLFFRFILMSGIPLGTYVPVLNYQVVPISPVVLQTGFTVCARELFITVADIQSFPRSMHVYMDGILVADAFRPSWSHSIHIQYIFRKLDFQNLQPQLCFSDIL